MRRLYAILERVAPTDATVLIQGETGTGKEVVAATLHELSRRAKGPFVAVDCGSITESLIESELFGHVKGSFSGATGNRAGLFEEAEGWDDLPRRDRRAAAVAAAEAPARPREPRGAAGRVQRAAEGRRAGGRRDQP